jgi:hypothetical protein
MGLKVAFLIWRLAMCDNLPAPLIKLDERKLPAAVREEIAAMVHRGFKRKHMMIGSDLRIYLDPELAMLYCDDEDHEEDGE